jgi:hypothetical protein
VLAAARKCRYCGYRFDRLAAAPSSSPSGWSTLLDRVWPARGPKVPVAELLHAWDVVLGPDEGEGGQLFVATKDNRPAYVLVTQSRLRVIAPGRSGQRVFVVDERELRDLVHAEVRRALTHRSLVLEWTDAVTTIQLDGSQCEGLRDAVLGWSG